MLLHLVVLCLLICPWQSFAHQAQCRTQLSDLINSKSSIEQTQYVFYTTLCWDNNPGTSLLQTSASVSKRPSRSINASKIEGHVTPSSEKLGNYYRRPSDYVAQSNATESSAVLEEFPIPNISDAFKKEKLQFKMSLDRFMDAFRMADRIKEAKLLHSFEPLMRPLERGLQGATIVLLIFILMMVVLPGNSGLRTLCFVQSDTDDKAMANSNVLRVMDEHQMRQHEAGRERTLETTHLDSSIAGYWYYFPLAVTMLSITTPIAFIYSGWGYLGMSFPVSFVVYISWKFGIHVALCSCVGIKKMQIFEKADFGVMYRQSQAGPIPRRGPRWEDVMHFVLIVNYKEDMETLTQAIGSVAASPLAKAQIGLVLAMEEREEGVQEKALKLQKEFADKFKHIFATFHPGDLPGEVPGKPSNTNWAGQILFHQFMPEHGIDIKRTIVTVMDADSEFHPQYFNALTYSFVHAGGEEDATPERYLTIWQPPILHYKNYLRQPALVRLASWVSSEHELANLADPYCTKLPYSTYSISAELAHKVNGWDPDWISEDQHMALKCFLATAGRVQVQPIFLAVMNYAPECDSLIETLNARWAQAKRHALGYGEIVYMLDKFGIVLSQISGVKARLAFMWLSFWLFLKMLTIHLFFATSFLIGPLTGSFVFYFYRHLVARAILPVYFVFQTVQTISLNWGIVVSVLLYVKVKDRVEGSDSPKLQFRHSIVHCLSGFVQYNILLPFLWCFGACAEWIASIKLTQTHRFDHEVAAKPTSLAEKIQQESAEDAPESH